MVKNSPPDFSKGSSRDGFVSHALTGGSGPSSGMSSKSIGDGQQLVTSFPTDNVKLAAPMDSSLKTDNFRGDCENLGHSIKGAQAQNKEVGAAGPVNEKRFKDH